MRVPFDFAALARPVAVALLGDPNLRLSTARELRYGRKGSFAVRLDSGQWFDHEAGAGGGMIALVKRERQCSTREALAWLESAGFVEGRPENDSEAVRGARPCGGAGEGRRAAYRQSSQASRRDSARRLWESTLPIAGTVAAAYLDARGVGHVAGARSLRFHPRITHPNAPGHFPALVAGVQDVDGRFPRRSAVLSRRRPQAVVDPVRASLGSLAGGAVRIVPMLDDAVLLGEGIESTASAVKVLDWTGSAWATLGTSGLRAVVLPASLRRVVVAADRDAGGLRAAATLAERLEAEGCRVTIEAPPFGDFADWQGESA